MEKLVLEQVQDRIAILTLNRPEVLNALSPEILADLQESVARVAADPEIGCVILTGAGKGFCSGGDLKQPITPAERHNPKPVEGHRVATIYEHEGALRRRMEAARLLHDMDKPTIAMINGPAAGAGLSLAGACDLRIAGASAVFLSAFGRVGFSGDFGGSWFWTKILGSAKARELYLLSEKMDAQEALAFGLVNRVYPDSELREKTLALAKSFVRGNTWTHGYMKRNLNAAEEGTFEEVLDLECAHMALSSQTMALVGKNKRS